MLINQPQKFQKVPKSNTENFKESIREIAKKDGNVPKKVPNTIPKKYQQSDNKWQIVSKSAETKQKTAQKGTKI